MPASEQLPLPSFDDTPSDQNVSGPRRRKFLLSAGNADLARHGIYTWSLPALEARLPDGRRIVTCPSADACDEVCYALAGTYRWRPVLAAHTRNLALVVDHLDRFEELMTRELRRSRRYAVRRDRPRVFVRIHDAGDFFSDAYLKAWLRIIRNTPEHIVFYAYTKEVRRFRRLVEPDPPPAHRFRWIYSTGGKHDALINRETDRHAEVFAHSSQISAAGYYDQADSDLLAVMGPSNRVGMAANNIAHLKARLNGGTLGELQARRAGQRAATRARRRQAADRANAAVHEPDPAEATPKEESL